MLITLMYFIIRTRYHNSIKIGIALITIAVLASSYSDIDGVTKWLLLVISIQILLVVIIRLSHSQKIYRRR